MSLNQTSEPGAGTAVAAGCLLFLVYIFLLNPAVILIAWNVGVHAVAPSAAHLSYIGAVGLSFALTILKSIFTSGRAR